MALNFLVGGMPRGGTTVAAKFLSLHKEMFCYAGETHLIPFMHSLFGQLPCREDKIEMVIQFLRQQFMTAMVEMPRFSVSQGAHPENLIFKEKDVERLLETVRHNLKVQLYGKDLYKASLKLLHELLSKADSRHILGEKTPNNIFAMAEYAGQNLVNNIVVMREPIGVLRSMKARVDGGDAYSSAFKGDLEMNIGMYLEYAMAACQALDLSQKRLLVRYEDIALSPESVVQKMFERFNRAPEADVLHFVKGNWNAEIANRAPMNYKRLKVTAGYSDLSPTDVWKVFSFTRKLREMFGYSDGEMAEFGFDIPLEWPDVDVPSKVLPLYGFHPTGLLGKPWMKKKGGVVAYLDTKRTHDIILKLKSKFPDHIPKEVALDVFVNGVQWDKLKVTAGSQSSFLKVKIRSDELVPMGNKGGYVVIDLVSSMAYNQIGHAENGHDARETSFQLTDWKIDKLPFLWWLRRNRVRAEHV